MATRERHKIIGLLVLVTFLVLLGSIILIARN